MKQILGDNQFFGVNHNDIDKGEITKALFLKNESIICFINDSLKIGLSGVMINSNSRGYEIVKEISEFIDCEIHYSIPYPHKFASMVNEGGMLMLLNYVINKSSFKTLMFKFPRFLLTGNIKHILRLIIELEIPKNLKKGSYIYMQNIVTDLILGMKRYDLLASFCNIIVEMGYCPGLITLNPVLLDNVICDLDSNIQKKLIVCFNINLRGFNVFPNFEEVQNLVFKKTIYKKMGMSILSSGGASDVNESLEFIKSLPLDYVVYGSSSLNNIKKNHAILS